MDEHAWLAERFEANRSHLRSVAYRMLGSMTDADDAVQESWLRFSRAGGRGRHFSRHAIVSLRMEWQ
jgi:DNA-directed RNA polymerase specialized sigma24 family protein